MNEYLVQLVYIIGSFIAWCKWSYLPLFHYFAKKNMFDGRVTILFNKSETRHQIQSWARVTVVYSAFFFLYIYILFEGVGKNLFSPKKQHHYFILYLFFSFTLLPWIVRIMADFVESAEQTICVTGKHGSPEWTARSAHSCLPLTRTLTRLSTTL